MYTDEEFKEGCHMNLFFGGIIGMVVTILAEAMYAYFHGWL